MLVCYPQSLWSFKIKLMEYIRKIMWTNVKYCRYCVLSILDTLISARTCWRDAMSHALPPPDWVCFLHSFFRVTSVLSKSATVYHAVACCALSTNTWIITQWWGPILILLSVYCIFVYVSHIKGTTSSIFTMQYTEWLWNLKCSKLHSQRFLFFTRKFSISYWRTNDGY